MLQKEKGIVQYPAADQWKSLIRCRALVLHQSHCSNQPHPGHLCGTVALTIVEEHPSLCSMQ